MTPRDHAAEAAKILKKASHRHTPSDVFLAFVDLAFCTFAKATAQTAERRDALEAQYMRQAKRWPKETMRKVFPQAAAEIIMAYSDTEAVEDHLGRMAGELGLLSSEMGQFFTPMPLCKLSAAMSLGDFGSTIQRKGYLTLMEPAAGGGAMVLACADHVRSEGYDPATSLWVEAVELNYSTYQMCFLALNLSGVAGVVYHGNSLSLEVFDTSFTAGAAAFVAKHGNPHKKRSVPNVRVRRKPKPQPRVRVRSRKDE